MSAVSVHRGLLARVVGSCSMCPYSGVNDPDRCVTVVKILGGYEFRLCADHETLFLAEWAEAFGRPVNPVGRGGKVGRAHPDTSRRAAQVCKSGSQQARALVEIGASGRGGATSAEIAETIGIARNQVATRILELREKGLVTHSYTGDGQLRTRATGPESEGQVWILTGPGEAECARLRA